MVTTRFSNTTLCERSKPTKDIVYGDKKKKNEEGEEEGDEDNDNETSPASSLIGETQRLVQSSGKGEEKTESNTQNQDTQVIGENPDPSSLSSSSGTAIGTSPPTLRSNH